MHYLFATAPKSNAAYVAEKKSRKVASETASDAQAYTKCPNRMMKELGYGRGYICDHDVRDNFSGQNFS